MITITCPHGHPIELLTPADAAAELGIAPRSLRQLARSRGIGTAVTSALTLYTRADIEAMRDRRPGRPAKGEPSR